MKTAALTFICLALSLCSSVVEAAAPDAGRRDYGSLPPREPFLRRTNAGLDWSKKTHNSLKMARKHRKRIPANHAGLGALPKIGLTNTIVGDFGIKIDHRRQRRRLDNETVEKRDDNRNSAMPGTQGNASPGQTQADSQTTGAAANNDYSNTSPATQGNDYQTGNEKASPTVNTYGSDGQSQGNASPTGDSTSSVEDDSIYAPSSPETYGTPSPSSSSSQNDPAQAKTSSTWTKVYGRPAATTSSTAAQAAYTKTYSNGSSNSNSNSGSSNANAGSSNSNSNSNTDSGSVSDGSSTGGSVSNSGSSDYGSSSSSTSNTVSTTSTDDGDDEDCEDDGEDDDSADDEDCEDVESDSDAETASSTASMEDDTIYATMTVSSSGSASTGASGSGTKFSGDATYYLQNGVAGACGTVAQDSDKVIALFTSDYANGSNCGRQIKLTNTANSQTVVATVRDECPTCKGSGSLDLSKGAFDALGAESQGVLPVTWQYIS